MPPIVRGPQLARIAAVVSSIVIVGLYVIYRSGGQTTTTSLPGSKGGVVQLNAATSGPTSAPATGPIIIGEPQVIYSTKSAPVFKPEVFSGSKSGVVFHASDATVTLTTQPAPAPLPPQSQPLPNQPAKPQ